MAKLKYFVLIAFLALAAQYSRGQGGYESTHGTLITVMGNKRGIVVVADSMRSYLDSAGHLNQVLTDPAQKLMQYDDSTVCATAGLLNYVANNKKKPSQDRQILPQLSLQVLGIVQAYRDAVKESGKPQSMHDALEGLSAALRGRFTTLADLDANLGHEAPEITFTYQLKLRLAGFDLDGEPKIGSLDLTVTRQPWPDGQMHWMSRETEKPKLEAVDDALLVRSAGIDRTEKEMLAHPERFTVATLMQDYISAERKDHGASLSIEYMKKLGHLFKIQTGYGEGAVGGADQVATIVKGKKPELEGLDSFQPIRNPVRFLHFLCGSTPLTLNDTINTGDNPVVIFQSCKFIGGDIVLGSSLFLNCTFNNVRLFYDGGDVLFEDDNVIEGDSRFVLRNSSRRPDVAKKLSGRFDFAHGGSEFTDPSKSNLPKPAARP